MPLLAALALAASTSATPAPAPALPLPLGGGESPERVVVGRTSGNLLEDAARFARGMAVSGVGGRPVCLLVEDELRPVQTDLLARLPEHEIVCVGEVPGGLPEGITARVVDSAAELFEASSTVVVTSQHVADVLEAAPEAFRRGVPLLVDDGTASAEVQRLGASEVLVVASRGPVLVPDGVERVDLGDAGTRWAGADEPYLAVANLYPGRSWTTGSPLAASLLAAARGGALIALEEPVSFRYALLERTKETPAELDPAPEKIKEWLVGTFPVLDGEDGDPIAVAVPKVGVGLGVGGFTPRYGDPIVDVDRDGRLDPATETLEIGSAHRIGDRDASISLRAIGAIGVTKFVDGQRTQRAVAISPPAEATADRLRSLYAETRTPRHLLVAGDHREIPFDYVKDPVYAASMMHEQELASDNLYADPDGDGYLDVAVGRFVSSDLVQATTLASRLATFDLWTERGGPSEATLIYPSWASDEKDLGIPSVFASFEVALRGIGLDTELAGFENHLQLREDGALELVAPHLASSELILFAHHSSPDGWLFRMKAADGGFQLDQLASPRNDRRPEGTEALPFLAGAPLIVGAGCDSAGLDFEVSFGDSIVHGFFEEGAVGYVGNTRAGFPDTEEFLLRHMLQGALGLLPHPGGPLTVGEAFRLAKNYLDFLIDERGPFRSVTPFEDYRLPMRREWTSLVYYGDPALRLRVPARATPTVSVSAFADGESTLRFEFDGDVESFGVWIPEVVGQGPIHEVSGVASAGLSYASVPWATYPDTENPGPVGPGTFVDLAVPAGLAADLEALEVAEGPDWALGGWRVVERIGAGGEPEQRLQVSVDFIRYAMARADEAEVARSIVLRGR